jgi:hypothetical protein
LGEGLRIMGEQFLTAFSGDRLERGIVETATYADILEAVHLLGLFYLSHNISLVFDSNFGLFDDFISTICNGAEYLAEVG